MIFKASSNVSMLLTKHENIQAFDHESKQECHCEIIQADEHLSAQVHIPLISQSPQHTSTIIKVIESTYVRQHDDLCLQDYRHFTIIVCALMCGYQMCEYRRM